MVPLCASGVDVHVDVPGAVIFDGNVLPVESAVLDIGEHPFLPLVGQVREDYHAVLLSRLEPYDPARVAVGDIPRMCAGIVDAKRRPVFLVGMRRRGSGVERGQDDHVLDGHSLEDAREMPFAPSGARGVAVHIVQLPTADELAEIVVLFGQVAALGFADEGLGEVLQGVVLCFDVLLVPASVFEVLFSLV